MADPHHRCNTRTSPEPSLGVKALVQYNGAQSAQGPDDPLWVMVTWMWRLSDNRDQRVTLLVSQYANRPELLPAVRQPSLVSGVVQPANWLMQSRRTSGSVRLAQAIATASKIAATLIESVQDYHEQDPTAGGNINGGSRTGAGAER